MRGRDSLEFTGALALGALIGAAAALLWRRRTSSDGAPGMGLRLPGG